MKCPKCGKEDIKVLRTDRYDMVNIRKMLCKDCSHVWATKEESLTGVDKAPLALAPK